MNRSGPGKVRNRENTHPNTRSIVPMMATASAMKCCVKKDTKANQSVQGGRKIGTGQRKKQRAMT